MPPLNSLGSRRRLRSPLAASAAMASALLLSACESAPVLPNGAALLTTNAANYTATQDPLSNTTRFSLELVVAIENRGTREISIQACADESVAPRFAVSMAAVRNDWSAAYESALQCRHPSLITLAVGESRVDRLELTGPRVINAETGEPLGNLEGRMRLLYYVDGVNLWSNAFEVRLSDGTP